MQTIWRTILANGAQARTAVFYGWRIVGGAFALAVFGWGIGFYGLPVYLQAIHQSRGWSVPLVSAAVTTHFVLGAVVVANLPTLYRRFGVAEVTKAGAVLLAVGVFAWASATAPWQLFIATLLRRGGLGGDGRGCSQCNRLSLVFPQPCCALDGVQWRERRRRRLLAALGRGDQHTGIPGRGGSDWGRHHPYDVASRRSAVFVEPRAEGLEPDGDVPRMLLKSPPRPQSLLWRDFKFLTLAGGMACGFAQIGLVSHLYSLMVPALGSQLAGLAMGLATASAIAGRTLVGWLMPADADRQLVACASYMVQIAGSVVFILAAGASVPLLLLGGVLFGSGIGQRHVIAAAHRASRVPEGRRTARGGSHRRYCARNLCVCAGRLWFDTRIGGNCPSYGWRCSTGRLHARRLRPNPRNLRIPDRPETMIQPRMCSWMARQALGGGGHWDVGAAFADAFGAQRVGRAGDGAENDTDRRQHIGAQDAVIHQRAGQQLAAVGVVDDVLGERLLLALRDAARDLPLRQ